MAKVPWGKPKRTVTKQLSMLEAMEAWRSKPGSAILMYRTPYAWSTPMRCCAGRAHTKEYYAGDGCFVVECCSCKATFVVTGTANKRRLNAVNVTSSTVHVSAVYSS